MALSVLNAKLSIPELRRDHIPRTHLLDRLQNGRTKKLTLLIAGPGYGKSSLLTEWAIDVQKRQPVVWYSLDAPDWDVAIFAIYLLTGLHRFWPELGKDLEASLNRPFTPDPEQLALMLLIELEKITKGQSLLLVIDDYHRLDKSPQVDRFLEVLLERLPSTVHLAISSRRPVGFSTGRLRSDGAVNEITEEDLRFRPDEIDALFQAIHPSPVIQQLIGRAEGWAAGLQIIFQACSLTNIDPGYASEKDPDFTGSIYEYLAEEVFDKQLPPLREFLLQSSILTTLIASDCDAIFERSDSSNWLNYLKNNGLFTVRLSQNPDTFRYHHLVTDFLIQKLRREVDWIQVHNWHQRAAEHYRNNQRWDEAFPHAIQADETTAAEIFLQAATILRLKGQITTLQGWLDQFSEKTYLTHPFLYSWQGYVWADQGQHEKALGAFQHALACAEPLGDHRSLYSGWVGLGIVFQKIGEFTKARQAWEKAVFYAEQGGVPAERATALNGLALIHTYCGENPQALEIYRRCLELAINLGKPMHALVVQNIGTVLTYLGEISEAIHWYQESLRLSQEANITLRIANSLNNMGRNQVLLGELDAADDNIRQAIEIYKDIGNVLGLSYAFSNYGEWMAAKGDFASAEEFYNQSIHLKQQQQDTLGLMHTWANLSELRRQRGDIQGALSYAKLAIEPGSGISDVNTHILAQTALALARFAEGNTPSAVDLLSRVIEQHRNLTHNHYQLVRCLWYLAYFQHQSGESSIGTLAEALDLAERWNYNFLIQTLAREHPDLLAEAVAANLQPSLVMKVIQDLGDEIIPSLEELFTTQDITSCLRAIECLAGLGSERLWKSFGRLEAQHNSPEIKKAASAALEKLHHSPPLPLQVTTLGRFTVKRGESEIYHSSWGSNQAQSLFKYLLAHEGQPVHRQDLVNILWPELANDNDPDGKIGEREKKAHHTLNQLISRIRQVLEPYLPPGRSSLSRYLLSEGNIYRLELPSGSWVDDLAFEQNIKQARYAWGRDDKMAAISHYQNAIDLYHSHYLVEERFLDWFISRREELSILANEAFERLADWHLTNRAPESAMTLANQLIDHEPLHERGYYLLMRAQYDSHQLAAALRTYKRYLKAYCAEMDMNPSEEISSLHKKILKELRKSPQNPTLF